MVGVALSRVRKIECLQILDLQPSTCKPPAAAVTAFLAVQSVEPTADPLTCCRATPYEDDLNEPLEEWVRYINTCSTYMLCPSFLQYFGSASKSVYLYHVVY
jgi:hypothetical protein